MSNSNNPMNKSPKNSSSNARRQKPALAVSRGTPSTWLFRWQLALSLKDRLEMISGGGDGNGRTMVRLASNAHSIRELIRRYSNDTML